MRLIVSTILLCLVSIARGDFALRDGDTVAFLGDSITAARGYTKIVEHYTLMRFPDRKVRFINAGRGGDTAYGSRSRLQKDVFDQGATVLTVAFGINDIGWGVKANEENKQRYLEGIRTIIEQCRTRDVRVFICSAAITAEQPETAEQGYLQKMCDEGLALAKSLGAETIDLQRGMREVQRRIINANEKEKEEKNKVRMHVTDGVHLNDLGQLAMAYALLKGLGAPADVSSATVDASTGDLLNAQGCRISGFQKLEDGVSFTREDNGLPITFGGFSVFDFRWIPIPDGINRYMLTVNNLAAGQYEITVNGRGLGKANTEQLARGMNITTMTANPPHPGGPWDVQSLTVKELVDSRDKLWMGENLRQELRGNHPNHEAIGSIEQKLHEGIVTLQRSVAKPYPYRFEIRRVEAKPTAVIQP